MTRFFRSLSTRTKIVALALVGLTLASVPAAAGKWHGHGYGYGYGYNGGAVAAGVVGGLILGGIAASAAAPVYYGPRCWIERRERVNKWGQVYVRDVEVCR